MKTTDRILAQRYARAFDGLSQSAQQAAACFEALRMAGEQLKQAQTFMQNPAVSSVQKKAFVQELFSSEKEVVAFLSALIEAKRYYLLDECVKEISLLLKNRQGIVHANVQTAFALTQEQKQRVEEALKVFSGKNIEATYEVEPSLLGGLRVRLADVLIDGSLKRKFEKLREEITK